MPEVAGRARHSTKVGKGDVCLIQSTTTAEPLVQPVYEDVLRAGGLPIMQMSTEGASAAFYELASDEQLDWVPPTSKWAVENTDVRIAVMADANSRELWPDEVRPTRGVCRPRATLARFARYRLSIQKFELRLLKGPPHHLVAHLVDLRARGWVDARDAGLKAAVSYGPSGEQGGVPESISINWAGLRSRRNE